MTDADRRNISEMRRILGREIRQSRIAKGIGSLREMGRLTGLSAQYLSQLERAYEHPSRAAVLPSDKALTKIAAVIDLPLERMQMILRRIPEDSMDFSPEATRLAKQFDALPPYTRQIVLDALHTAQAVAESVEERVTAMGLTETWQGARESRPRTDEDVC